jgi:hypothetical protein
LIRAVMVAGVAGVMVGPDGDLVLVVAVEGVDVERGVEGFFDPVGGGGQDVPC